MIVQQVHTLSAFEWPLLPGMVMPSPVSLTTTDLPPEGMVAFCFWRRRASSSRRPNRPENHNNAEIEPAADEPAYDSVRDGRSPLTHTLEGVLGVTHYFSQVAEEPLVADKTILDHILQNSMARGLVEEF